MKKAYTIRELIDTSYGKYKVKKAVTIEREYTKNINFFNFRFDVYSMARIINAKKEKIGNNVAIISEGRYEFLVTYLANIMINNTVLLIDGNLNNNIIEKNIRKFNIKTIFFSNINKEKVLEISKSNNLKKINLVNFDSYNQYPIIEYEKLINIGRYIENYSLANLLIEKEKSKNTIIINLDGTKRFCEEEIIENAYKLGKNIRVKKKKPIMALSQINTFYRLIIGVIIPVLYGLDILYQEENDNRYDISILEEHNKNITILYRKNKYIMENTGINANVVKLEDNLLKKKQRNAPNFILIKSKDRNKIEKRVLI